MRTWTAQDGFTTPTGAPAPAALDATPTNAPTNAPTAVTPDAASGTVAAGSLVEGMTDRTVDQIVDALEQRVLAEVERRGGRYSGLF